MSLVGLTYHILTLVAQMYAFSVAAQSKLQLVRCPVAQLVKGRVEAEKGRGSMGSVGSQSRNNERLEWEGF
jgi:hypothetical protein